MVCSKVGDECKLMARQETEGRRRLNAKAMETAKWFGKEKQHEERGPSNRRRSEAKTREGRGRLLPSDAELTRKRKRLL